jgi:hypothetical protein
MQQQTCLDRCIATARRANVNCDPPVRKMKPVVQDTMKITNTAASQNAW